MNEQGDRDARRHGAQVDQALDTMRRVQADLDEERVIGASVTERFQSRLVDLVAVWVLLVALLFAYVAATQEPEEEAAPGEAAATSQAAEDEATDVVEDPPVHVGPTAIPAELLAATGLALAMFVAYEVGTTAVLGMTPGKRWGRIRVVRAEDMGRTELRRLALRTLVWAAPLSIALTTWFTSLTYAWLGAAAFLVVTAWTLRSDERRGLHELASDTRVVLDDSWRERGPESAREAPASARE